MTPKAIIFDVYGTLISTGTGSLDAAREILQLNGRDDISPKEFYGRWKALHRMHIDSLTTFKKEETIFEADLHSLYAEYGFSRDAHRDVRLMLAPLGKRQAFPETAAVCKTLSARYLLAVGSTTDTAPLLEDLARAELDIPFIYTSESMKVYKPRRVFYETILHELNLSAHEALFVGDSLLDDVAGPKQAGMKACWVNREGQAVPSGATAPDYIIPDLTGLLDILNEDGGK